MAIASVVLDVADIGKLEDVCVAAVTGCVHRVRNQEVAENALTKIIGPERFLSLRCERYRKRMTDTSKYSLRL